MHMQQYKIFNFAYERIYKRLMPSSTVGSCSGLLNRVSLVRADARQPKIIVAVYPSMRAGFYCRLGKVLYHTRIRSTVAGSIRYTAG